ncbi:phage tail tape measure protein [Pseudomonas resinovorans]|uniref:phage tail tape measure protein n=1 Tax=Metapseudomonas resinovorans TaxID=53412 RepID=UPI00237F8C56|nr:phage tail tape measure protein [Pseudomonas resinovorans]MDE3738574.1 phage tail tape measure protein [Pseudomonas resinovorans]
MASDVLKLQVLLSALDRASGPLKKISQGSGATARALKAARDQLKSLNQAQRDVSAYRQQHTAVRETSERLAKLQNRLADYKHQLKGMNAPSARFRRTFRETSAEVDRLREKHSSQREELRRLVAGFNSAGISTRNLGTFERSLTGDIERANAAIKTQTERMRRLSAQQERLRRSRAAYSQGVQNTAALAGTGMAARATGLYTGRGLQTMLGVGYEFDATMSATQAVTRLQSKNSPEMQALREQARTLPLSSKFTDSEVAQGQYFLGRTGYTPQQILGAMPGMLNLAAAGDMDLGTTADIASNIQMAMGIPAEEMNKVADVLTAAFTRNNVDIQMLGGSLKYSAAVGREYGQSLETVTAATALLGNAGIQDSQAGTAMRSVLTRIGMSSAVAKLGVVTADENGNMRDLLDILTEIHEKTKDMGNLERGAIYKSIAGQYAVTGFGTLMRAVESGQFQGMRGNLEGGTGESEQVARTQLDNLKGDMTILHAALENISVELFDKNSPWLRELAQDLSHLLHNVGEFLKENPALSKAIVITVAGFSLFMATLGSLAIGIAGILGPMIAMRFLFAQLGIRLPGLVSGLWTLGKTVIPMVGRALLFAGRALMLTPIGLVITAITAVALAAYLIYEHWEPIKAFFSQTWDKITMDTLNFLGRVTRLILDWNPLGLFYTVFADLLNWLGLDLPRKFSDAGVAMVQGLINGFTSLFPKLSATIGEAADGAINWFKTKLGIHSPSRVFAALGQDTMAGLAQGLAAGEQGPLAQLSDLAKRMTGIGALTLGMAGSAIAIDHRPPLTAGVQPLQIDSHDTVQIIIQPTPGIDAQAIARAVAQELDKRERAKLIRARSALFDRE